VKKKTKDIAKIEQQLLAAVKKGRKFDIKILQGSAVTLSVRWVNYTLPFYNFPVMYICQKSGKSADVCHSYERRRSEVPLLLTHSVENLFLVWL